jgi:hypothetical protein
VVAGAVGSGEVVGRRVGVAVAGTALLALLVGGVLTAVRADPAGAMTVGDRVAFLPLAMSAAVGLLLVHRLPRHPVGWLLTLFALLFGVAGVGDVVAVGAPGTSAAQVGGWLSSWLWVPAINTLSLTTLLFPDGRLVAPRWRAAAAVVGSGLVAGVVLGAALWPQRHLDLAAYGDAFPGAAAAVGQVALPATVLGFTLAVASLLRRAVGADATTRMQLKWLLFAVSLLALALLAAAVRDRYAIGNAALDDLLGVGGLLAVPVAIGVAITRHRLYDIDRIISRTVSYTVVVAGCVTVYGVGVLVLQRSLGPVLGGSDLAVAGSTLAAVAVARPLLTRTRHRVDRRFDRAAYDAVLLVERFADRSRRLVEAADLRRDLLGTVATAVEPTSVSLLLLEGPSGPTDGVARDRPGG